jgi:predicted chitinase
MDLFTISQDTLLADLTSSQVEELQLALHSLGYPVGEVDGLIGPRTRNAWAEFKEDEFQGRPDWIGPGSLALLKTRLSPSKHDYSTKQGVIAAIRSECIRLGLTLKTQQAYVIATAQWETANTFKPVREAFWKSEAWRKQNLRYWPYYGRGLVQLTWKTNYQKYGKILGINLVGNPDLALNPNVSLFTLVHGFLTGSFTGRKLTDYVNNSKTDFTNARRCINGKDKALQIADLVTKYLN